MYNNLILIPFHYFSTRHCAVKMQQRMKSESKLEKKDPVAPNPKSAPSNISDVIAKALGYLIGLGSMTLYTPIIHTIWSSQSGSGFALQTWIFTLMGLTLSAAYPFQKGFPLSAYVELMISAAQAIIVLGLLCHFDGILPTFALGMGLYSAVVGLLFMSKIPPQYLNILQIISTVMCNYANIPQIILSFQLQKTQWSSMTAAMCVAGNLVRIFTTIQLTNDPLFLVGYVIGVLTNGTLLVQTIIYAGNA